MAVLSQVYDDSGRVPHVAAPRPASGALPPHEAGLWLWAVAKLAAAGDLLEARAGTSRRVSKVVHSRRRG